jgi:dTDP-4-amino-4,6-dideoxygalactose transaminase
VRAQFLPFHVPSIGDEEIRAVTDTLRSGWLTTGEKAKEFEAAFAALVGARHAIALNSGTAALHLALEAIGLKEGDEVIVPTMTFAATAEVVCYFNARPVLVDCERDTFNIVPDEIEKAITGRTRAIIPVHIGGQPCDMDPILEIARRHHLKVIEDAAHALPSAYKGRRVGALSDITCFSFYATKTLTTAEGGMATTENPEWAERIRQMSLHGLSHDAWNRYTAEGSWYYEVVAPGFKYNMPDVLASIGIEQLRKCVRFHQARKRCAALYGQALSGVEEILLPLVNPATEHAWHLYVIRLALEKLTIGRNRFIEELKSRNIGTSVHFIPLHRHPYYRVTFGCGPADFPSAEWVYQRSISLPIYPDLTDADVGSVAEAIQDVVKAYRR